MSDDKPKRKPSRLTLAPLYLAAGLAVCYLVLTQMIPVLRGIATDDARKPETVSGWAAVAFRLSDVVRANSSATITVAAAVAIAGFLLPLLIRPARYLVWLAALAVFLLDVALAGGTYVSVILNLAESATNLGR
jgi:hypothetical protein